MLHATTKSNSSLRLLVVEDNPDDRLLMLEAWKHFPLGKEVYFVNDGVELLDYLYHQGPYADPQSSPRPDLVLLDLYMPKKDGHQVLVEIQSNNELKPIPIVIFSNSMARGDMTRSCQLGAATFLHKPVNLSGYEATFQAIEKFLPNIINLANVS